MHCFLILKWFLFAYFIDHALNDERVLENMLTEALVKHDALLAATSAGRGCRRFCAVLPELVLLYFWHCSCVISIISKPTEEHTINHQEKKNTNKGIEQELNFI